MTIGTVAPLEVVDGLCCEGGVVGAYEGKRGRRGKGEGTLFGEA